MEDLTKCLRDLSSQLATALTESAEKKEEKPPQPQPQPQQTNVAAEMRRAFPYYKKASGRTSARRNGAGKCTTSTTTKVSFKMCCLAGNSEYPPEREEECTLAKAGLGLKTVDVGSQLSHQEFKLVVESHFHRLQLAKGNWLLFRRSGRKQKSCLVEIPPGAEGYTPKHLTDTHCIKSKMYIYIIPLIQLSSEPMSAEEHALYNSCTEKCAICAADVPVQQLREHYKVAHNEKEEEELEEGQTCMDEYVARPPKRKLPHVDSDSDSSLPDLPKRSCRRNRQPEVIILAECPVCAKMFDTTMIEEHVDMCLMSETSATASALDCNEIAYANLAPIMIGDAEYPAEEEEEISFSCSATDAVKHLKAQVVKDDVFRFNINRLNVWDSAVRGLARKTFSPFRDILVQFTDSSEVPEGAIDCGGPRREFLRLLMDKLSKASFFIGPSNSATLGRILSHDMPAVKKNYYYLAGMAIVMSLAHGGPPPVFLSPLVIREMYGETISLQDIEPFLPVLEGSFVMKLANAKDQEELDAAINECDNIFRMSGARQYRKWEDRVEAALDIAKWLLFGRSPALDGLKRGLQPLLSLCDCLAAEKWLCPQHAENMSDVGFMNQFQVVYSETGSSRHAVEQEIVGFWRDYITECKEGGPVSLEDVLQFTTGLRHPPPLGLDPKPEVRFLHDYVPSEYGEAYKSKFPTANTCANTLNLPTVHQTYDSFILAMNEGVLSSPGFGMA